jgi:RimJ/RimL family protein N-acetyltransferase
VEYARETRIDVCVLGDDRGFVTLGRGLAGRIELGFEVHDEGRRGRGFGRELLLDALTAVPAGEPVFAACSPGNARSLRCLLAAGFRLLGAEVLIRPDRNGSASGS